MPRFRSDVPKNLIRIVVHIPRNTESWLQDLSNEMKLTGGYKLPRSYIIRAILDIVMLFKIDVSGVRSETELKNRILQAIKRR